MAGGDLELRLIGGIALIRAPGAARHLQVAERHGLADDHRNGGVGELRSHVRGVHALGDDHQAAAGGIP